MKKGSMVRGEVKPIELGIRNNSLFRWTDIENIMWSFTTLSLT